ncbi:MAG: hypothetical protein R3B57_13600 [Phycisphaerales bacterium]
MKYAPSVLVGMCVMVAPAPALAGVVINAVELGGDVVVTGGGTLDLSLWTYLSTVGQQAGVRASMSIEIGSTQHLDDLYYHPVGFSGPNAIGPGHDIVFADHGGGNGLGLFWLHSDPAISTPAGYTSGDPLGPSTATFSGHTFASLGLTKGSYTWVWDTADGNGDFFTINVTPSPGTYAIFGVGCCLWRRRRLLA